MGQAIPKQPEPTYSPPERAGGKGLLQRKCNCGNHSNTGECKECSKQKLQRKLTLGDSDDPLEREADRVADQVLDGPTTHNFSTVRPSIQRASTLGSEADAEQDKVPGSVEQTLASAGRPMPVPLRRDMENRFGRDFSQVRLHTDALAERSTGDVDARAYTVGNHVVFGQSHFAPETRSGRQLLAHELTHVVQQGASSNQIMRAPNKPGKGKSAPKDQSKGNAKTKPTKPTKPKVAEICGRPSRKVKDNFITKVTLDVGTHRLQITWDDPATEPALSKGTHAISPGMGKCCKDCNDETTSQTSGSLCTPKGGEWPVTKTRCALGGHPTAKNPTYFQRGGVAIHCGNLSNAPASHGCARTSIDISELIHDNVKIDKTKIAASGTWTSSRCFMREPDKASVNRTTVCDGSELKPPPKKTAPNKNDTKKGKGNDKAKGKQGFVPAAPTPLAETLPANDKEPLIGEQFLAEVDEYMPDGPGPDNASAEAGGIPEDTLADVILNPDVALDEERDA